MVMLYNVIYKMWFVLPFEIFETFVIHKHSVAMHLSFD